MKDSVQIGTWVVAIIAGSIAAYRAISEMRRTRQHRERELTWNQAKLAKEMLTQFELTPGYHRACCMLDWASREYQTDTDLVVKVDLELVLTSLRITNRTFSDSERFVRDSFITLFNSFEWLEHFISRDLITIDDLMAILGYRVKSMARNKAVFVAFLNKYCYDLAMS